ncbi:MULTISPECIES: LacI family DNA-binding transcriptional regulator [Pseudovibrio]|uniref:LacI family DNA-binding transcriptional regulator n=1 Tax=Stappiaceae TaxID=2821832 RepID=UPI0023652B91|nr:MULTISPECIES: LacI family DNA-binding transcriptional regulator [Pseudovibrio]MDD7911805.1 LacI family DNA-binding transcriptional regulator [Pseudovibrio exalbescens]MDX5594746.1 LacI family DNA-binding transcriptional regulator [Pseudovibrio sp. SPO723]
MLRSQSRASLEYQDVRAAGKRLRLGDLAEKLGISTATVSLALRDSPLVAKETRQRVKDYAAEVGYIYNRSAASLRTSQSDMIGVAVHDILNPYFAEVFRGLEEVLAEEDKTILICNHRDMLKRQDQFIDTLLQHRVDGLILCPSVGTSPERINQISEQGVAITLVCRDLPGVQTPCVRGDDYHGSYLMTKHLIDQGHRQIAMIGGRRQSSSGRDRNNGWRAALVDAGIDPDEQLDIPELMTQADGQAVVPRILSAIPRPTAVACFNDLVALGVLTAVRRAGVEPGPELAITGYDDTEGVQNRTPALTTVANGAETIGREAAQMMLKQINGEPVPSGIKLIKPELRIRESAPPIGCRLGPVVGV